MSALAEALSDRAHFFHLHWCETEKLEHFRFKRFSEVPPGTGSHLSDVQQSRSSQPGLPAGQEHRLPERWAALCYFMSCWSDFKHRLSEIIDHLLWWSNSGFYRVTKDPFIIQFTASQETICLSLFSHVLLTLVYTAAHILDYQTGSSVINKWTSLYDENPHQYWFPPPTPTPPKLMEAQKRESFLEKK